MGTLTVNAYLLGTYTEYRQLQAKYWFIRLYGYLYISSILHVVVIETLFTGTFTLHRYL